MKGNQNMKSLCLSFLILSLAGLDAAQIRERNAPRHHSDNGPKTYSSLDQRGGSEEFPPGAMQFDDAALRQVLEIYQQLSGRSMIQSPELPNVRITFKNQTPLTRIEVLQTLDTILAEHGIAMITQGKKLVKAVPAKQTMAEGVAPADLRPDQLPESSSYVVYIVELKHARPRDVAQALVPFARLPNSVLGIDSAGLLILRDYSANVRRMLEVLARVDRPSKKDS